MQLPLRFEDYQDAFQTIKLERSESGILQVTLHENGGPYAWHHPDKGANRGYKGYGDPRPGEDVSRRHRGGHGELSDAFSLIARDPGNRVIILTGAGDVFAAPAKISYPSGGPELWEDMRFYGTQLLIDMLDIPAPVISCINGPAFLHVELLVPMADVVLAADDVVIQDSGHFINGMVPGDGLVLLPYLMGTVRARYFLMTGQKIGAKELLDIGLVNEVMPRSELLPRAWELAEEMVEKSALVLRYSRLILTAPLKAILRQQLPYAFSLEALAAIDSYETHKKSS